MLSCTISKEILSSPKLQTIMQLSILQIAIRGRLPYIPIRLPETMEKKRSVRTISNVGFMY